MKQKKVENDRIQGDLDQIVDLFFGENNESFIERGIIDECDFLKDVI